MNMIPSKTQNVDQMPIQFSFACILVSIMIEPMIAMKKKIIPIKIPRAPMCSLFPVNLPALRLVIRDEFFPVEGSSLDGFIVCFSLIRTPLLILSNSYSMSLESFPQWMACCSTSFITSSKEKPNRSASERYRLVKPANTSWRS